MFEVGVSSPLRLAGFLTAVRTLVETSAPGLVAWHVEKTADGRPFVRLSSSFSREEISIYYATTPKALIVSLNEKALVAALDRWNPQVVEGETRKAIDDEGPASFLGETVSLELEPRAMLYLGLMDGDDPRELARLASYDNLPILAEWRRLAARLGLTNKSPVDLHATLFGERLVCPGGEGYAEDAAWDTIASTVFGHPADRRDALALPPVLRAIERIRLGLTYEPEIDGLRARGELQRKR